MADLIQLVVGSRPWAPHPDAKLIEEFNRWNIPTLGILQLHGQNFLFECFTPEEPGHIWRYVHLDDWAVEELRAAEDVYAAVDKLTRGRYYTLAAAQDDVGLFASRHIEEGWDPETAGRIMWEFVDHVRRTLDEFRHSEHPDGLLAIP
jgi:hypothetical protein